MRIAAPGRSRPATPQPPSGSCERARKALNTSAPRRSGRSSPRSRPSSRQAGADLAQPRRRWPRPTRRRDGADSRALGRREHAAVDPAHDDDGDEQHWPDLEQYPTPLGSRQGGRRTRVGVPAHGPSDRQQVEAGGQQAGDQRRHEQLGDVLLGRDRVDDQDHRGGSGCRASRQRRACRSPAGRRSRSVAARAGLPGSSWPWWRPTSRRSLRTRCAATAAMASAVGAPVADQGVGGGEKPCESLARSAKAPIRMNSGITESVQFENRK